MKRNNKKKGKQSGNMRCPYCGSHVIFRSADGIYYDNSKGAMLYVCSKYPECDAYVRVHAGTKIPVGTLANHELRTLRRTAHRYFNQLYLSGLMTKRDAYRWLGDLVGAPQSEAHIGHLYRWRLMIAICAEHGRLRHLPIRASAHPPGGAIYLAIFNHQIYR